MSQELALTVMAVSAAVLACAAAACFFLLWRLSRRLLLLEEQVAGLAREAGEAAAAARRVATGVGAEVASTGEALRGFLTAAALAAVAAWLGRRGGGADRLGQGRPDDLAEEAAAIAARYLARRLRSHAGGTAAAAPRPRRAE